MLDIRVTLTLDDLYQIEKEPPVVKMTVAEVAEKLGHGVEIVEG